MQEEIDKLKPRITIAEIRAKNNKMTQKEFGDSIGVSMQTVSSWEKDRFKISPRNLAKIKEIYGYNSTDILGV
ncbi:helix-turn-helix transcriptional regulator [Streptococcus dysgalactiae]|nr:helix-turn-helix transcriptional regulator [Streptococcus dysgalactiae]